MNLASFEKWFYLQEAISLKNVRKQKYIRKMGGAYKIPIINDVFNGKDRLIYPIRINDDDVIDKDNPLVKKVIDFLSEYYPDLELRSVSDYVDGKVYKKRDLEKKQPMNIGKLLNKHIVDDKEINSLLDAFKKDPVRSTKNEDYFVVVSRHPYDIAGMSTDRNWTSCMRLGFRGIEYRGTTDRGVNARFVNNDIDLGSIVAYLVTKNEILPNGKVKLRRPLSRILLKPHVSTENSNDFAYSVGKTYGAGNEKFKDFLTSWLIKNINKDTQNKQFRLIRGLYNDSDEPVNFKIDTYDDNIPKEIFLQELENYSSSNVKYFDQFAINTGGGESLNVEIRVTFTIPESIKLHKIRRDYTFSEYEKGLLECFKQIKKYIRTIETFPETNQIIFEYHLNLGHIDEKTQMDDDEVRDMWEDIFSNYSLAKIDYLKCYNCLLEKLKKEDPELAKAREKKEELKSIQNDFKELIESPKKSKFLQDYINRYNSINQDFRPLYKAFDKIENASFRFWEDILNISKDNEFIEALKTVKEYEDLVKSIKDEYNRYTPRKYHHINATQEWSSLIDKHFNFYYPRRAKINIVNLINQRTDFLKTHSEEEYETARKLLQHVRMYGF